ncbi:MAG: MoaD/ThiS family protein [Alphaproteobacteria bacterium]|nr:MoaD/ThiS family protein [Alphaproteobacteria bacterium]
MGGQRTVIAEGKSIAAVLEDLATKHPEIGLHIFDESGGIRRNLVFLHAGAAIRATEARDRVVKADDEIVLTNALAGG